MFSSFLELGEETVDAIKFGGAENVVKTETQQTFAIVARFYYFEHAYTAGSWCVLYNSA